MEIKTPTNVVELMENLLAVFRNRQVFDEAFYTEENIRQLTAAQDVEVIRQQKNPILQAGAFGFWAIADNLESYGAGLSVNFRLEIRPDGKKSAVIHSRITSDQPLLHYLVIEKMAGHPWRPKAPRLDHWTPQRRYQKPTDPYGNAEREYSRQDGDIEESGTFQFDEAGLLNSLFLRGEER